VSPAEGSLKPFQARLGHASATGTLDTYAHLWLDSEDRTRRAVYAVMIPMSAIENGHMSAALTDA
jgi:hypothetical protein